MRCLNWNDSVPEQAQSACPIGHPISAETNNGFSLRFLHDPFRNHLRKVVCGTFNIAERNSRREMRRVSDDFYPYIYINWTKRVNPWATAFGSWSM